MALGQLKALVNIDTTTNEIWAMADEADGQYVSSVLDLAWQVTDPLKDRHKATASV